MSRIHNELARWARKRWPAASGAVIARMWTSTRSRTSTISSPIRGCRAASLTPCGDDGDGADVAGGEDGAEHGSGQHRDQLGPARVAGH